MIKICMGCGNTKVVGVSCDHCGSSQFVVDAIISRVEETSKVECPSCKAGIIPRGDFCPYCGKLFPFHILKEAGMI